MGTLNGLSDFRTILARKLHKRIQFEKLSGPTVYSLYCVVVDGFKFYIYIILSTFQSHLKHVCANQTLKLKEIAHIETVPEYIVDV